MRVAIFESILTSGGHEVDFDRLLVEELEQQGHEPILYVPEGFPFQHNYTTTVRYLSGQGISYAGATGLKKNWLSLVREHRRYHWFQQLYQAAAAGHFDTLIVPTSTYRYLRGLRRSKLKNSPVPIVFIVHGVNPTEKPKLTKEIVNFADNQAVKVAVIHCGGTLFPKKYAQVRTIKPPTYLPRDMELPVDFAVPSDSPLTLGFFGQYRREKNLEALLKLFLDCHFERSVQLKIQGSTVNPEDRDDFDRIIAKYGNHHQLSFLHKGLFGREWQQAIAAVDALIMPYAAPRYRYHWGGMLFTAIGFQKPVLLSEDINPEVLDEYNIGQTFDATNSQQLKETIEKFVNSYDSQQSIYHRELVRACEDFAPARFVQQVIEFAKGEQHHDFNSH
jgi:glycosyltransferase involved in cell wall biosynthesis